MSSRGGVRALRLALIMLACSLAVVDCADDSGSASAALTRSETVTSHIVASATALPPTRTATCIPTPTPSAVPTRLVIPSIGVDAPVAEVRPEMHDGVPVWGSADHVVAHYSGTAMPGQKGNVFLAAHIRHPTEGAIFARLPEVPDLLERGVRVTATLYTADGIYEYVAVEAFVVEPTRVDLMAPTSDEILTLMTCVPDWVFSHRLIVICRPPLAIGGPGLSNPGLPV